MTCSVFASVFVLLPLFLSLSRLCVSLPLLLSACPLCLPFLSCLLLCPLWLLWLVVSFSLTVYTQKERAQGFAPCVLSCCGLCGFIRLPLELRNYLQRFQPLEHYRRSIQL